MTNAFNKLTLSIVGAALLVPLLPARARADDDWEDYLEELEEQREELEEDWEDAREEAEERWERHRRYHRSPRYYSYQPGPTYYGYPARPGYAYDYPYNRRVVRYYRRHPVPYYRGRIDAGPATVYYGRHGAVHVGPIHVFW